MFEKENVASGPGTVVGVNVKLTGTLKDLNDITIHGQVDGEVISEKNVLITETASVKGPVTAKIVTVSGKLNGSVTAIQRLEITPTGNVYGSISTKDLIIKSGAVFVGKSAMLSEEKTQELKAKEEETKEADKEKNEKKKANEPKKEDKKSFWKISSKKETKKTEEPKYELE